MPLCLLDWPQLSWRGPSALRDGPRVLGINPWIYDFAAYNFWLRPAGLLACLEMLRQSGCTVGLLDCLDQTWASSPWPRTTPWASGHFPKTPVPKPAALRHVPRGYSRYGLDYETVAAAMARQDRPPDIVLLTCLMTYWLPGAAAAIELVRRHWPATPIVLGGTYASLCTAHAQSLSVDLLLSGPLEAPENWAALWRLLGQTATPPLPAQAGFDLGLELYPAPGYGPILGSRGCPFACGYCASKLLYGRFVQRKFLNIWEETASQLRNGVRNFAFFDDALLVAPEVWLIPLLERLAAWPEPVFLHTPNALHVRYLTPALCRLLKAAGLTTIRLGLESTTFTDRHDAKLTAEEWEAGLAALLGAGFDPHQIGVYILFGLPDESPDQVRASIAAIRRRGLKVYLTHYSPLPGTPLFERALAVSGLPLADEPLLQNNSIWPCVPGGFTWQAHAEWKKVLV